jgi:hypothetical protein
MKSRSRGLGESLVTVKDFVGVREEQEQSVQSIGKYRYGIGRYVCSLINKRLCS